MWEEAIKLKMKSKKAEVVSEDVDVGNNGVRAQIAWTYLLHVQGLNYGEGVFEPKGHVGEEALSSNLSLKLRPIKTNPLVCFRSRMVKNAWVGFAFPYALLPLHEGVE